MLVDALTTKAGSYKHYLLRWTVKLEVRHNLAIIFFYVWLLFEFRRIAIYQILIWLQYAKDYVQIPHALSHSSTKWTVNMKFNRQVTYIHLKWSWIPRNLQQGNKSSKATREQIFKGKHKVGSHTNPLDPCRLKSQGRATRFTTTVALIG